MKKKLHHWMRDLFSVGKETNSRDERLEILTKQILKLQNQLLKITEQQKTYHQTILKKQEALEEKIENQKIEATTKELFLQPEEESYIMLEEKKEEKTPIAHEEYVDSLEKEIIKSVAKNKKTIIKQKILAIASKQRTTSKNVKEIIVDKYRYCSKATFYRYLSELKRQQKIETITINNKEYVCNISIDRKTNSF
ncbi:hypothetical protein JXA48_04710 [Candidatus Woesearchaeota archaeon]|nr:hypothetical protein [Candidatus Woesearchaeota archaeon]